MKCVGTRPDPNRLTSAAVLGERHLELLNLRTQDEPPAVEDLLNRLVYRQTNRGVLRVQVNEGDLDHTTR